jgi:hypothetical protein
MDRVTKEQDAKGGANGKGAIDGKKQASKETISVIQSRSVGNDQHRPQESGDWVMALSGSPLSEAR